MNKELKHFVSSIAAVALAFVVVWFLYLAVYNWWAADSANQYRHAYVLRGEYFFIAAVLVALFLSAAMIITKARKK